MKRTKMIEEINKWCGGRDCSDCVINEECGDLLWSDMTKSQLKKCMIKIGFMSNKYKTIKIKYFGDVDTIEKIKKGDWIDLRAAEDVEIKAGEYKMIPLGVAMELPKGYEAIVAPRSSTFKKYGVILVNSIGVIDESYCGDNDQWQFLAYATRDTAIPKNERICQFRILKHQPDIELVSVEKLGNKDRGGIGSTDTNNLV